MKNILKKLHIGGGGGGGSSNPSEGTDGSKTSATRHAEGSSHRSRGSPAESPASAVAGVFDQKPFSNISCWFNSISKHTHSSASHGSPSGSSGGSSAKDKHEGFGSAPATPSGSFEILQSEAPQVATREVQFLDNMTEEEFQIRLAMEQSVKDDPEAVEIEAVKQLSLGPSPSHNTPAEVVAYRYWNYNVLDYDEKILDGFYDLYGVVSGSTSEKMPSLVDLQGTSISENMSCEAILVNRVIDPDLVGILKKAYDLAIECRSGLWSSSESRLVHKIANLVNDSMGGPVGDPDKMLKQWIALSENLRASLQSIVLPLGRLTVGLARHRALLFKVLAESIGIPCRLVKGRYYMGTDEEAVSIVKIDGEREYIVDLMGAPGMLIPSDVIGTAPSHSDCEEMFSNVDQVIKGDIMFESGSSSGVLKGSQGGRRSSGNQNPKEQLKRQGSGSMIDPSEKQPISELDEHSDALRSKRVSGRSSGTSNTPYLHARTPSWTEGIGSPAVRRMKVKDVSQYMMDAAKENPKLAQKLHDVLLESGVVAPPNLFTEIPTEQLQAQVTEGKKMIEDRLARRKKKSNAKQTSKSGQTETHSLPPVPQQSTVGKDKGFRQLQRLNSVKGLGDRWPLEITDILSALCTPTETSQEDSSTTIQESLPSELIKHVPVAAAAAATAAVVASSMVVAASKANAEPTLEVPVAAAATATAAVVVATTAAVGKRNETIDSGLSLPNEDHCEKISGNHKSKNAEAEGARENSEGSNHGNDAKVQDTEHESISAQEESPQARVVPDDVKEWEIPWEDIRLGERIGLGSYGEVYRGEWHGTEVAVKKFLDQDLSGVALEEFKSEVRIMKRLRHPNVVLFMGAITRVPNLSIVTEFLPRGSLYRLIHRPNNQLDEKKRLRMALDVARGMNYLHSSNPVIVHRDLKSPNLLVDKNWVVKVCDFGLSRMKHNTFISSRSTAGTAEWMAPEVLRNEPSNEKCDVFSFGVILWELATLQQPWEGMNPMQVVGAVGFQHRRLDLPSDMNPVIADIVLKCWNNDPKMRPSFAEIMAALKPLQRPSVPPARQRTPGS